MTWESARGSSDPLRGTASSGGSSDPLEGPAPPRRAGMLVPLFSLRSDRDWGIGEIGDIAPAARWLESAGLTLLQLLPINELPPHETSPYSSLSAMAVDPQYLSMGDVEDFAALGGERALEAELRTKLESLRVAPAVDYAGVRRLKHVALRRSYERFRDTELRGGGERARAFRRFTEEQAWWLDDYALFRALHERRGHAPWTEWPDGLRNRDPFALADARVELGDDVRYRQYLQWLAEDQWQAARAAAGPVVLFGDLTFMVALDSADVWAHQDDFRLDASLGVPPDAFSETGQDWKLPVYKWDVIAAGGFAWLHQRARRNAALFGGYRVDHLVGFYRTFSRPLGDSTGPGEFTPPDEPSQTALGERVLQRVPGVRRAHRRRGPGRGARLRPRVADADARWPAARCFAGSGSGTRRGVRSRIPRPIRRCRWRRPARTIPSRWSRGGSRPPLMNARPPWRFPWWPSGSAPTAPAPRWTPRRSRQRSATHSSRRSWRRTPRS